MGTFYAAPAEDAEPFVKVGDSVKEGQVLAIVEAMKLMNEIESDFTGNRERNPCGERSGGRVRTAALCNKLVRTCGTDQGARAGWPAEDGLVCAI